MIIKNYNPLDLSDIFLVDGCALSGESFLCVYCPITELVLLDFPCSLLNLVAPYFTVH